MKYFLFFSLFLCLNEVQAQKHDNKWLFGYRYGGTVRRMTVDFDLDSIEFKYSVGQIPLGNAGAWICDSIGTLKLITSGCIVGNEAEDTISNGAGLNPGFQADLFCEYGDLNATQYGFFLPAPHAPNQYYLIHYNLQQNVEDLMFTKVGRSEDNNQPLVLEKNVSIVHNRVTKGGFAAIKHGNGRDWWLVCTVNQSNEYYILLLDPEGFTLKAHLFIGEPTTKKRFAEMNFSPDGTKLAYANPQDDLRLFDFDRCTGTLSNPQFYPVQDTSDTANWFIISGMAFSADSRYLYRTTEYQIYQYDMLAPDIGASRQVVAEYDGFHDGFAETRFGFMERAPDGRIFCETTSGSMRRIHVIWHPERVGEACDVRQHVLQPPYPVANIPMFPLYQQGAVDGSSCDTLGFDNHPLAGWRYDKEGLVLSCTSVSWYEPEQWSWTFGDPQSGTDNSSTERNPTHLFSHSGTYEVCLVVSNAYGADTLCKTVTVGVTGVQSPPVKNENGVLVYPNPASDWVYFTGIKTNNLEARIYNQLGTKIKSYTLNEDRLYLGNLPDGMYRIHIFSEGRLVLNQNIIHINP